MNVIKSLQGQVYPSKNIHGLLRCTCGMPVPTFNVSPKHRRLEPDPRIQIKNAQVIQSHLTVPASENVHVVLVDDRSVSKPDFRLNEQTKLLRYQSLLLYLHVLLTVEFNFATLDIAPAISANLVAVHV